MGLFNILIFNVFFKYIIVYRNTIYLTPTDKKNYLLTAKKNSITVCNHQPWKAEWHATINNKQKRGDYSSTAALLYSAVRV